MADFIKSVLIFTLLVTVMKGLINSESFRMYFKFFSGLVLILLMITPLVNFLSGDNGWYSLLEQEIFNFNLEGINDELEVADGKFEEIIRFCKENNLWLIEDAAQALGSTYKGQALGTFGDVGSYSFSMPKIITTGQGGAIVTKSDELYNKLIKIRDFGREYAGSDHYVMIGANFKFTDLQAVIGIEQMKKMPDRIKRKKEICRRYDELLSRINGIELYDNNYEDTAPCFYEILCDERDRLIEFLKENNIGARKFYPPLHSEPAYNIDAKFPVTEEISAKGLWLPSSVLLTDDQLKYICDIIKKFYCK